MPAFEIQFTDETGYSWISLFASQEEALAQAVSETQVYAGETAQEIVDDGGATVVTHEEIVQAAEE